MSEYLEECNKEIEYEMYKRDVIRKLDKLLITTQECLSLAQAYAEKLDKIFEEAFEYFSK